MERTGQNIQLSSLKKPKEFKHFLSGGFREVRTFSSQSRYDHFDTAPRYFCLSDAPEKGEKRRREQTDVFCFQASKNPKNSRIF